VLWGGERLKSGCESSDTDGAENPDESRGTGGSSFVPAVRRIFEERFGREKLRGGGEFVSVARGLAMCGRARERVDAP
jgi:molecular chaperone DnaK (HSP70)